MKLAIYAPWRGSELKAKDDLVFLKKHFKQEYNTGFHSIFCSDPDCEIKPSHSREVRAFIQVERD